MVHAFISENLADSDAAKIRNVDKYSIKRDLKNQARTSLQMRQPIVISSLFSTIERKSFSRKRMRKQFLEGSGGD